VHQLANIYRARLEEAGLGVPNFIGGWSFGGVIAQEMVRQWEDADERVEELMMLDSPIGKDDHYGRAKGFETTVASHAQHDRLVALSSAPDFVEMIDNEYGLARLRRTASRETMENLEQVHAANVLSLAGHSPRQVRARTYYLLPTISRNASSLDEAHASLSHLTSGTIRVESLEGDHFSIIRSPHVQKTSALIWSEIRDRREGN